MFFWLLSSPKKSTTISGCPQSTKHRGDNSFKEALEIAVQDNDALLKVGEMIQFDDHIFQTGCFNHQVGSDAQITPS